jgi:hypothetical protein
MPHGKLYRQFRETIYVTQNLIDNAIKGNSSACMVAESIKAHLSQVDSTVHVDIQTIRFTIEDKRYIFLTPKIIQPHITNWDMGIEPKPFSFKLNTPSQVIPSKNEEKRSKKPSTCNS